MGIEDVFIATVFSDIRGLPECGPKQALQQKYPQKELEKASSPALQSPG